MAAPHVEPASATDAEDIAALHLASWRRAYSGLLPRSFLDGLDLEARRAQWRERLALPHGDDTFVLVSRDGDGRPAGFASAG
ncbi:MAG: N-acetyltransferase, partial [Acidimicrobiaceae bacterium]|nr:N-acetyltransferase [Acidimicrobiaceae bacterium]